VGNPQQLGQQPIHFNRQVTALVAAPFLLDHPSVTAMFSKDVIERARKLVKTFGSVGAYTDSRGNAGVRQVGWFGSVPGGQDGGGQAQHAFVGVGAGG